MYVQALVFALSIILTSFTSCIHTNKVGDVIVVNQEHIKDWEGATNTANKNREKWSATYESLDVDPALCESIIFPELLRYNLLKNSVEEAALMSLYVTNGTSAANFSVGMFQMKPSFVEEVEMAWMNSSMRHQYQIYFPQDDSRNVRNQRAERIKNIDWQCVYVALFVKLMYEREPSLMQMDNETQLRYLATAYNFDFMASMDALYRRQQGKMFHLDLLKFNNSILYSYADLAVAHYNDLTKK